MVVAAVAQICSRNNVSNNLKICTSVIRRAAEGGAKLVCLPEASDYIAPAKEGESGRRPMIWGILGRMAVAG